MNRKMIASLVLATVTVAGAATPASASMKNGDESRVQRVGEATGNGFVFNQLTWDYYPDTDSDYEVLLKSISVTNKRGKYRSIMPSRSFNKYLYDFDSCDWDYSELYYSRHECRPSLAIRPGRVAAWSGRTLRVVIAEGWPGKWECSVYNRDVCDWSSKSYDRWVYHLKV